MGDEPSAARRADWLARLERWTDRPLTVLALLLLPLLLAPFVFDLAPETENTLLVAEYIIWGLFAADLVVKLIVAPSRLVFLRRHWLDVVLVVVPIFRPLRALRFLRIIWAASVITRVIAGGQRFFARRGTGYVLLAAAFVVLIAAALVVAVERDEPHASIRSFSDGLWWAMTTVTTVGYGDKYPLTAVGRGIAVALMILGIAAFGVVTANLAALFIEEQDDEERTQLRELSDQMRRIETTLEELRRERDAT